MGTPVNVVTMYEGRIRGREIRDGVPVYRLPTFEGGGNRRRAYPWLVFLGVFLVTHRKEYDVIHVHQALHAAAFSVWVAHLLGKKCLVKVAGSGEAGNIAVLKSWRYSGPMSLKLLRRADRLISLSPEIAEELRASGFDPSTIVQIPNGVDLKRFQKVTPVPGMSRSVIVPARLAREKALDVLIRAWAQLHQRAPDWRLAILGEGPERGALEAMVRELGLGGSVTFFGEVPDVSAYLAASKVFVLPSRHGEGMSNALLEAMAAGCACLVSDIEANTQLIEPGVTGDVFRSEDVDDLATRLAALLADESRRRRVGQAAAALVAERYGIDSVARRYQELYRRLIVGEPAGDGGTPSLQT